MLEDAELLVFIVMAVGIIMNPYQNTTCLRPCISDYFLSKEALPELVFCFGVIVQF